MGICAASRITGFHKRTIPSLLVLAGKTASIQICCSGGVSPPIVRRTESAATENVVTIIRKAPYRFSRSQLRGNTLLACY